MSIKPVQDQISILKLILYHFYPGVAITLFYVMLSGHIIQRGYPGLTTLLIAELVILLPIGLIHLFTKGMELNGSLTLKNVILFTEPITLKQYIGWSLAGIALCVVVYVPFYPVGLYLRENLFQWLPEWYFNPVYGSENMKQVANIFLVAIIIDGLIGPIIEELFFRGYLLPRMAFLKNWAPIVNGILFGLYHFWQPHNYLAITAIGVVLSWIVWKKRNVYLGIIIHCSLNISGAIAGYIAVSSGVPINR